MRYGDFGVAGGQYGWKQVRTATYDDTEGCCLDMVLLSCPVAADCFQLG
jgi:hypothetical protein